MTAFRNDEVRKMVYLFQYESPLGGMTAFSDGTSVTGLHFGGKEDNGICQDGIYTEKMLPVFEQLKCWLDLYFQKKIPDFMPPAVLQGSEFRMAVWDILKQIPYGQTLTYGDIAKMVAKQRNQQYMAAQAVGGALRNNPIAILVPCHRVLGSGGKLTGYAGGLDKKKALLALEYEASRLALEVP